jgi:hypothetical protein
MRKLILTQIIGSALIVIKMKMLLLQSSMSEEYIIIFIPE